MLGRSRGRIRSPEDRKAGEMQSVQIEEVTRLDRLLDELGTEAQYELLHEHLESARVYLLGLMPAEYALSLKMAEESLDCVTDSGLRNRIEQFIHGA